jgi:hypothetical protein
MGSYLRNLPKSVAVIQESPIYDWGRQVTPRGFWRLLIQGHAGGTELEQVTVLSWAAMLGAGAILICVVWRWRRCEKDQRSTDRLIAATIAAMPLVMPYYMDYDLLLLSIPATLLAGECIMDQNVSRFDRRVVWAWSVLFIALYVNPGMSGATRVNLAAALVAIVGVATMIRCLRVARQVAAAKTQAQFPVAKAA